MKAQPGDQPGIDAHPTESFNGSRRGRWNTEIKRLREENADLREQVDRMSAILERIQQPTPLKLPHESDAFVIRKFLRESGWTDGDAGFDQEWNKLLPLIAKVRADERKSTDEQVIAALDEIRDACVQIHDDHLGGDGSRRHFREGVDKCLHRIVAVRDRLLREREVKAESEESVSKSDS